MKTRWTSPRRRASGWITERRHGGHAGGAVGIAGRAGSHCIEALADIAQNGTSESARVSAACAILDRTHGRPRAAPEAAPLHGIPPGMFDLVIGNW